MKIVQTTLIFLVLVFAQSIQAQSKYNAAHKLKPRTSNAKNKIRKGIIISAGCVNARAINLVKPQYPSQARLMNTHGIVSVYVLIDEGGNVIRAKAVSGNYILRASAIAAARESRFNPTALSGVPVKVNGTIVYNFVTDRYNWLEIGHAFGSSLFAQRLPAELYEEKEFYAQYETADETAKTAILQNLRASIENKLRDEQKKLWLFRVGILLNEMQTKSHRLKDLDFKLVELKTFLATQPEKISPTFVSKLENIVRLYENAQSNNHKPDEINDFDKQILDIYHQISDLGN